MIGYLMEEPSIEKAEEAIRNTFAIACNQFVENIESGLLEKMHHLVKTHKNDFDAAFDDSIQYERMDDANFREEKSSFYRFIKNIAFEEQARASENICGIKDCDFKMENAYYADETIPELIKIFSKLQLTGCLLNESFGLPSDDVPTLSQVETNFRVVNLDLFQP